MQTDDRLDLANLVKKDISIDNNVLKKKHCRFYLALHPYSYSKMRLVRDRKHSKSSTLFFGDIPAFTHSHMHNYQPVKFQYGLARVDRPWCNICRLGKDADLPPVLPAPTEQNDFYGSWVTRKCEAVNEDFYVTTIYMFEKESESFTHVNAFFLDRDCKTNSFTYLMGGSYISYRPSGGEIEGLLGLRLTMNRMRLTPYDKRTLSILRNAKACGRRDQWRLGREQDVTETRGCPDMFSVQLPYVNNVIVRAATIENHRKLYIEDDSNGMGFSYNLVPCDTVTEEIIPKITTVKPTERNKKTEPTLPNLNKVIVDKQIEQVLETYKQQNEQPSGAAVSVGGSVLTLIGVTLFAFFLS